MTEKGSGSYVESADRIAVFDNDGTLWNEKPLYIHFFAVFDHMKKQIEADPSLKAREPYKSLASKDKGYFLGLYEDMAIDKVVPMVKKGIVTEIDMKVDWKVVFPGS